MLPLVLLVVVASIQIVGLARARLELQGAARDGVRVAATTPDPARAVEAALSSLSPEMRERTRVSVERPATVGSAARVKVSIKHLLGFPFPATAGVLISASAAMPVEQ